MRRGDVIWSASFDETQKSLSENIFAIGDIISERGVRWLTRGATRSRKASKKRVAQLHQLIARAAISNDFCSCTQLRNDARIGLQFRIDRQSASRHPH